MYFCRRLREGERAGAEREPMRAGEPREETETTFDSQRLPEALPGASRCGTDRCDGQEQRQREWHSDARFPAPGHGHSPFSSRTSPPPWGLPLACPEPAVLSEPAELWPQASTLSSPQGGRNDSPDPDVFCGPLSMGPAWLLPAHPPPELPVAPGLCAWLQHCLLTSSCFLPPL